MLHAGLEEDVIITSIKSAAATAFDVTPKGLIELSQAKASKHLIQTIQAVAGGKPPAEEARKPAPKSAKKKSS